MVVEKSAILLRKLTVSNPLILSHSINTILHVIQTCPSTSFKFSKLERRKIKLPAFTFDRKLQAGKGPQPSSDKADVDVSN